MQAEAAPEYGLTNQEQQQEYSDISASTSAAVNQDSKQIADAAGRSLFAQDAPLTGNLQLSDPEIQLENININLNSVPLPSLESESVPAPSSEVTGFGAQSIQPAFGAWQGSAPTAAQSGLAYGPDFSPFTTGNGYNQDQLTAYDSALLQGQNQGETYSASAQQAAKIANDVGLSEQLDAEILTTQDPATLTKLLGDYGTITDALASTDVYFNQSIPGLLPAGVTRVSPAELSQIGLTPSELVDPKSGFYAAVYKDSATNQYIVANRGTVPTLADVGTDVGQSQGLYSQQYFEANRLAQDIQAVQQQGLASDNVLFTGHSLGGGLAATEALSVGEPAVTFNAAGVSEGTINRYGLDIADAPNLVTNYSVNGELLTSTQDIIFPLHNLIPEFPLPTPFGPFEVPTVNAPEAVGTQIALPAVSLPEQTASGVQAGTPLSGWARLTNTGSLHSIYYVLGSLFYQASQTSGEP